MSRPGPTSRKHRRSRAVLFGLSAIPLAMLPTACAFWELDDWSARAGSAISVEGGNAEAGGADASLDGSTATNYCATVADASIFCDDFDTSANPWTVDVTCSHCTSEVAPPDAGGASPSPPNALSIDSQTGDPNPAAYRQKTIFGSFTSITSDFWADVDRADVNGEPALEDIVYTVGPGDDLRVRVYVNDAVATLSTVVTATTLSSPTYTVVATTPFTLHTWHHVIFTLSTLDNVHRVYWNVDGTIIVPSTTDVVDGNHVPGAASQIDLQTGVYYVGALPTTGATNVMVDNVMLRVP